MAETVRVSDDFREACELGRMALGRAPVKPPKMTRKRICELTTMAKEIADNMDKRGIQEYERCQFGVIVQHMLQN